MVDATQENNVYRLIFEASLDGIALVGSDGIVVDVNPALGAIDGYARHEVLGKIPPPYRDLEDRKIFAALIERVLAGEIVEAEVLLPHKDGGSLPVETRSVRIDHNGAPHMLVIVRDLSERKQHEGDLQRSEDLYRTLFDSSTDGLAVLDAKGVVVDVNPALEKANGFSREELIGQLPPSFRDPSKHEMHQRFVELVFERGVLVTEGEYLRRDGGAYVAEMRSTRIDFRGEPHILVVARDISERRSREFELARSEDKYRTVFEGMVDGLAMLSADGVVVDANQAMLDLDGYARSDLIGSLPPTYIGDDERMAQHLEYVRRVLAGKSVKREFVFQRKDGSSYFAEVRPIVVQHNDEPHVLLVIRNISSQKAQHAALVESEDRFRATIDTALDCIVTMDESGRVIDFNPAAESVFGYTHDEAVGQMLDDLIIPESMRDAHRQGLAHYLATGEGPYLGSRLEVDAMRKDGSSIRTELAISAAHGSSGQIFIGYLRDITAQRHAAEQRERLEAQLRQAQKMEAIGHLTGGIAHDFNNILTSILGYVSLARDRNAIASDEKLVRYLERAEHAGARARDLIAKMMTFSRGQQGTREQVDVVVLVEEALKLLESSLPSSIEMTSSAAPTVPMISIDPVHLEQILVNLCINARDAMDGHGRLKVNLVERRLVGGVCAGCRESIDGHYVELSVSDTGPGIDPQLLERIFEPFFTTKDVGKGSGMGLSTVHGIVHDYAGHTLVDSTLGEGVNMRVLLPVGSGEANEDAAKFVPSEIPSDDRLYGRGLVVDDNPEVSEYLEDLLNAWGLEVTVFNDPSLVDAHLASSPYAYDFVITDQTMPRLSGLELSAAILARAPELPIFLYTGYSETVTEETALAAGISAFLQKPLDTARLRGLVEKALL